MNDLPRQKLCELIAVHGRALCDDPQRCEALLAEACPQHPREVAALSRALEGQVAAKLIVLSDGMPWAPVSAMLTRRLVEDAALSDEAARWAVDAWAQALGKGPSGHPVPAGTAALVLPPQYTAPAARARRWRLLWLLIPVAGALAGLVWWYGQNPEIRRFEGHTEAVFAIAFSPDGSRLLSGSSDKTLRLWDVETGKEIRALSPAGPVRTVAYAPDGRFALCAGGMQETRDGQIVFVDCSVHLWDLDSGEELQTWEGPTRIVRSVAFAPDGRTALSAGGGFEFKKSEVVVKDNKPVPVDCVARLWDVASGEELMRLEGHTSALSSAAFSPDGRRVLTGAYDATLRLWDAATGKELRRFEGWKTGVTAVAFSPDGRRVLAAGESINSVEPGAIRLLDTETGEEVLRLLGHSGEVSSLAFSPDGRRALSGSYDFTVRLWDLGTGQELRRFKGHSSWVTGVAYAPDGRRAASASGDYTVRLWRLPQ